MKTLHLRGSAVVANCSRIDWRYPSELHANDIQKLLSKYDVISINCGSHIYMFNVIPCYSHSAEPFTFDETNTLMYLIPDESDIFYIKAAIREFMNTYTVFNSNDERVYPGDIV